MIPKFIQKIPGIELAKTIRYHAFNPFLRFARAGHFYSPIPDPAYLARNAARIFDRKVESVPGVDHQPQRQLELADAFAEFYNEQPFRHEKNADGRYYFDNSYYSEGDAIVLYSMMRHFRPRRIVEVGSGFSSAVMLDTNDKFLEKSIHFTFIDPYPQRLLSLLNENDKRHCEILDREVQSVPLDRFDALEAGDILFIDSSHVAKAGSDVVHMTTHVLPRLKTGVIVHVHDIFWPFEYPEDWFAKGRAWNENYMMKAFLQFNSKFKIIFFNSYLALHHAETMNRFPLFMKNPGAGLWIEAVV